ncbi:MAG: hypothetical protein ACKOA9_01045 [Actinomycetota bacterium]
MSDEPVVVGDEPLPDGRRLLVYADGRQVVVGRAGPRPHPVAGWEWLGRHPSPQRSRVPRPPPPRPVPSHRAEGAVRACRPGTTAPTADAERRAERLLRSLLDATQRRDYDRTGGFWVPTPRGLVRLGRLYALVHRPADEPLVERVLCVVPDRHLELPRADVWTNLLLTLAVEPDTFFRVAVLRGVRTRWP